MIRFVSRALFLAVALGASAGDSIDSLYSDEELLALDDREVYVVEILEVRGDKPTNGHPPGVTIRIREAMRGNLKAGDEVKILWYQGTHGVDWTGEGRAEAIEAWNNRPCEAPGKGSVWILMSADEEARPTFLPHTRCRYPFEEKRHAVVARALQARRDRVKAEAEAARVRAAAVAKRREEDGPVQEKIDAAAAARSAEIVLVGKLGGFDLLKFGDPLGVRVEEFLKGAKPIFGKTPWFSMATTLTEDEILTIEARAGSAVIVFFGAPRDAAHLDLGFPLQGGVNAILSATPERLKAVREALERNAERK